MSKSFATFSTMPPFVHAAELRDTQEARLVKPGAFFLGLCVCAEVADAGQEKVVAGNRLDVTLPKWPESSRTLFGLSVHPHSFLASINMEKG